MNKNKRGRFFDKRRGKKENGRKRERERKEEKEKVRSEFPDIIIYRNI